MYKSELYDWAVHSHEGKGNVCVLDEITVVEFLGRYVLGFL